MNGETSLWAAVITQAITDATSFKIQGENPEQVVIIRAEARVWLTIPNPDFAATCIRADLDEHGVRALAIKEIAAFERSRDAGQTARRRGKRTYTDHLASWPLFTTLDITR